MGGGGGEGRVGSRNWEERRGEGVKGLTDVDQVDLLSFLHELEGNLNVLSLLNREARVCLGSAVEWVKGEGEETKESTVTVHTTIIKRQYIHVHSLQDVLHFHFHGIS